jgi:hypothetical protein
MHQSSADVSDMHQSGTDASNMHQSSTDACHSCRVEAWSTIMGKLCQRVLALIKWRKGFSEDVSEETIRILEQWLCNWGPSIYTEQL